MTGRSVAVMVSAALTGILAAWADPAMAQLHDPCPWVNDGECDEPNGLNVCAPGTDTVDCSDPTSNFGTGSGYAGGQHGLEGAGLLTWAPWHGESNDGRSHATQPGFVTPLNAHGPVTAPGPGWGLMDGVYDIYTARSNGWGQPLTDIGRLSDVRLGENATYVFDLNHFGYGDRSAEGAMLAPTTYGAWNMYPAPGVGRTGILVHNSDVTGWRWVCVVPAGEPFANCENYDPLRIIRSIPDDPTIPPPSGPGTGTEHRTDDPSQRGAGGIRVLSATYGNNCGAPSGNVTPHLAQECEGAQICTYTIDYTVIGDPVYGCAKDYIAEYSCGDGRIRTVTAEPEAGFQRQVTLDCAGR